MILNIRPDTVIVFDLDDTLYKEVDFVKSAYKYLSDLLFEETGKNCYEEMCNWYRAGKSAFDLIKSNYNISMSIDEMVDTYRHHSPNIHLSEGVKESITELLSWRIPTGIITDGRSATQRNKLKALGLEGLFDLVVISEEIGTEKPHRNNFLLYNEKFSNHSFAYIADNISKDFVTPNALGWLTICLLDNGQNIHKQDFSFPAEYLPQQTLTSFLDLEIMMD
ncbi:MAG: HAD family hydrolase [Saprospiraceae bacterium]|nr:HAD family hydrolase [Saprospiraceae bacterium]